MLTIKGNDLHINRLSVEKGDLEVEGRVDALLYSEVVSAKAMGESFSGRECLNNAFVLFCDGNRDISSGSCFFWA